MNLKIKTIANAFIKGEVFDFASNDWKIDSITEGSIVWTQNVDKMWKDYYAEQEKRQSKRVASSKTFIKKIWKNFSKSSNVWRMGNYK